MHSSSINAEPTISTNTVNNQQIIDILTYLSRDFTKSYLDMFIHLVPVSAYISCTSVLFNRRSET